MFRKALLIRNPVLRCVRMASSANFVVLGDSKKFTEIMKSDTNKILYFTASWCPPCKKIAPIFEKFSHEFAKVTFVKIDIDDFRELAEEYKISSVPTFKAFAGSKIIAEVFLHQHCNQYYSQMFIICLISFHFRPVCWS